jgi:ATP-dependent DNA ligase I
MRQLAEISERVAATTKKNEKVRNVADYFRSQSADEAAIAAIFLSGRIFPAYEEITLQVGGTMLWQVLREISRLSDEEMAAAYRRYGDLGSAAFDILQSTAPQQSTLTLQQVEREFHRIAETRGAASKASFVRLLLSKATALEAKYLVKIISGDLRIGLRESLVEEAIAKAFDAPYPDVQRANMLLGDIAETLRLASDHRLADARMRMFHPIGFMLASPVQTAGEAFTYFEHAQVEDKYDGIRAQAHVADGEVRLYSRTLDEITDAFPELLDALAAFPEAVILDGEVLAWSLEEGRALPFSQLQKRLGRKKVTASMMRDIPVAYVVFDILYVGVELTIDKTLRERSAMLDDLFLKAAQFPSTRARVARAHMRTPQGSLAFEPEVIAEPRATTQSRVIRAPLTRADSAEHLAQIFEQALERGNEGLMIKDLNSSYAPGRRGRSWLKLKRELATLDVVVTAVEFGHGKRSAVLSDYTFAVRAGETDDRLLNVGKAYSGLTDAEISHMTQWFLEHTIDDQVFRRTVEPKIVLEVAFNAVMKSDRHESGYALRFPRILRLRPDKTAAQIDTLERVSEIYQRQLLSFPSKTSSR